MATIFEVQSKDITELSFLNLTKLLNLLLHLEAKTSAIAESSVDVGLNIFAPDGGEDGRIEWTNGPDNTNYLPSRLVQFQNKATDMSPSDCANEIVDSRGNLKRMVNLALNKGGAYILFTTQELNGQQKHDRINAIREKLEELENPYAHSARIDIYDATKIQGWVNNYIPAITAVLNWINKPIVHGLYTWDEWEKFEENHLFEYVSDNVRNNAIESLRVLLAHPRKCARIIGPAGLGKTRLALEVCRGHGREDEFSKRVVYIDAAYGEPNLAGLVNSWVKLGLDCLLVVDNCDLRLHKQIRREIELPNSTISLLTLHYDPEKDLDTDPIQLGQMSKEQIKEMLVPVYGDRITDLERIVSFASGFPQMAVLLAKARLDQTRDMGSLTDDDLVRKMLWGGGPQDKQVETILQACALFDKFGIEKEREEEAKFIAESIAGTDLDTLYRCINEFEKRGLVNRAGRLAQIVPKPLAIRLAADWWRSTRVTRQQELIETEMPRQLERSFCDQVAMLDFLPQVKELTENLCGDQGPFGQAEVILSDRGSLLFRSLVEVNPKATSETLYNILSTFSHEQLNDISGDVRRNLVWALEKLCFHQSVFERSAKCLLLLASAENENWSNNATGQFIQLFRTFLSGTEAPPANRLALLDEAIKHGDEPIRYIVVQALATAIDTYGGSRAVGAEYQGSGEPLVEWRPKIWQEAFDYWTAALERLTALTLENSEVSQSAKAAIARHIRGLIQRSRDVMLVLDKSIKQIVNLQGPLWPMALGNIKEALSFDSDSMHSEAKQKLDEWIELLTPNRLEDRIALIVSNPPYEHEKGEDGHYVDIAALNAEKFAQEFKNDISQLLPHLDQLLMGEQREGYLFGRSLVITSNQWEPILSKSIAVIQNQRDPNINFLMGLLNGVYELDRERWSIYISNFEKHKNLNKYYPDVIRTGKFEETHLYTVIELIESGYIKEDRAYVFTYGRALEHLDSKIVIQFIHRLHKISFHAAWISLDILSMYCHGDQEKWDLCTNTFKEILSNLSLDRQNKTKQLEVYHWQAAAEKILKVNDIEFAKKLTQRILQSCSDIDYSDLYHYIKPIMRILLKDYGKEIWPLVAHEIKVADPVNDYHLSEIFSKEDSFNRKQTSVLAELSEDILHQWCRTEPETAPLFIAHSTDVYIEDNDEFKISSRALFLIDEFGENNKVLRALSANMGSFGWTGSVVPIFNKEIAALEPLIKHKHQLVREWVDRRITYLKKAIERENVLDEESEWGVH